MIEPVIRHVRKEIMVVASWIGVCGTSAPRAGQLLHAMGAPERRVIQNVPASTSAGCEPLLSSGPAPYPEGMKARWSLDAFIQRPMNSSTIDQFQ